MTESRTSGKARLFELGFGTVDLASAALVYLGVFVGLPARWWPVDVTAAAVIAVLALAGVGLLRRQRWAADAARLAGWITLGLGLLLVGLTAITASYLSGIYGAVGRGGSLILTLVAA